MFYANYVRERMRTLLEFEEAEGNPVVIEDSLKRPLRKLHVFGESVQDGTPTPDAPLDIVSVENPVVRVTGNNLFNIDAITDVANSITNNGDGTLMVTGYPGNTIKKIKELCPALKIGDVVRFFMKTDGYPQAYMTRSATGYTKYLNSGGALTVTEDILEATLQFYRKTSAQGGGAATISDIQIVFEGCPDVYEPYIKPQEVVLDGITLRGVQNSTGGWAARDEVIVDSANRTVKLITRCYEVTITDKANFSRYTTGKGFMFQNVLKDDSMRKHGLISNGKQIGANYALGYWLGVGNKAVYWIHSPFFDETLDDYGVANVKEYLMQNPIQIVTYYNTPIETDITDTEAGQALLGLYTNKGITRISLDAESNQGELKVKYVRK